VPLIGHARVSTRDQHPEAQTDALSAAGCEKVFVDHASGTLTKRTALEQALDYLRAGDTLVITKLDRPSRSVRNLNALADELQSRQVGLRALVGHDQAWYVTGRRPAGQIKAKHSRTRARAGGWTSGRAS